jgi:WD40 repeat protein
MTGHTGSIYSLAFSAESSLLVSGGADWTVRCWDVKGAGGSPGKPRENGAYTSMGLTSNEAAAIRGYGEEENTETYVIFFLSNGFLENDLSIPGLIYLPRSPLNEPQSRTSISHLEIFVLSLDVIHQLRHDERLLHHSICIHVSHVRIYYSSF